MAVKKLSRHKYLSGILLFVGDAVATVLARLGIATIGQLAQSDRIIESAIIESAMLGICLY